MKHRITLQVAWLSLMVLLTACAPTQVIRPYPNFIETGVKPGDQVEILTTDGETQKFKVVTVDKTGVKGLQHHVLFENIKSISKKSWREPNYPCGNDLPLGCSVPRVIRLVDGVNENTKLFEPVCMQHDFCYRHGYKTYGKDRTACDDEFRSQLKQQCNEPKWLTVVSLSLNKKKCLGIANQMYQAVRRYGEKKFRTDTSSYCEYDGPDGTKKPSVTP